MSQRTATQYRETRERTQQTITPGAAACRLPVNRSAARLLCSPSHGGCESVPAATADVRDMFSVFLFNIAGRYIAHTRPAPACVRRRWIRRHAERFTRVVPGAPGPYPRGYSMNLLTTVITLLSVSLSLSSAGAATLTLTSGQVRYDVHLKTLGVGGDAVSAVNQRVIGRMSISERNQIEGGLIIPVIGFDSNNTKRDKDVANILKYKEHPAITFEVIEMNPQDVARVLAPDSGQVILKARITAAGESKVYEVVLEFRPAGANAVRFTTHIDAKFTDFGIKPPRLGLILKSAPDKIDLSGDLVFTVENGKDVEP
jgi:hypothetical protein